MSDENTFRETVRVAREIGGDRGNNQRFPEYAVRLLGKLGGSRYLRK